MLQLPLYTTWRMDQQVNWQNRLSKQLEVDRISGAMVKTKSQGGGNIFRVLQHKSFTLDQQLLLPPSLVLD